MKNIAIAFSLLALTLAGCNSPQTNTSEVDGDVKLRSVSVTVGDLSNPFFVVMGQGAEQEAKKLVARIDFLQKSDIFFFSRLEPTLAISLGF